MHQIWFWFGRHPRCCRWAHGALHTHYRPSWNLGVPLLRKGKVEKRGEKKEGWGNEEDVGKKEEVW